MKEINTVHDALEHGYKLTHVSTDRGYVSRKLKVSDCRVEKYSGKHGEGFKAFVPNYESTYYCLVHYYTK